MIAQELEEYLRTKRNIHEEICRVFKTYCEVSGEYYGYGVRDWSLNSTYMRVVNLVTTRDPMCGHETHNLPLEWLTLPVELLPKAIKDFKDAQDEY